MINWTDWLQEYADIKFSPPSTRTKSQETKAINKHTQTTISIYYISIGQTSAVEPLRMSSALK